MSKRYGNPTISRWTVTRRLAENNIFPYKIVTGPAINQESRLRRLKWAEKYVEMPLEFWRNITWSDEAPFSLNG
jgi:DNA/RNA endonuclease G (NUC1)